MGQSYPTLDSTLSPSTAITNAATRTDTLRTSQSGSSAPGSPAAGWLWCDTTSATDGILKVYDGDAWVEVGTLLHADLAFGTSAAPYQALYARQENRTAHITPGAGQIGRFYLFTTDAKARVVVSATVREVVLSASNVDYMPINLPITSDVCDATNPPTLATKGTTPTIRGRLFDAANELMSWTVRVPQGYAADADCKLRLACVLNQGETAGDDIDWTADLVATAPGSTEVVSATSTAYTVAQDCGANINDGCIHEVDVALTYNDATNPIAAGDELSIEIHRTNLSNCGGVILVRATLLVPFGTKVTE